MHVILQRLPAQPAHNSELPLKNVGLRIVSFRIVAGTAFLVRWWDRVLSGSRWIDEWLVASNLTLTQRASPRMIEGGSFQRKWCRQQEGHPNFVNPADPESQHHFQLLHSTSSLIRCRCPVLIWPTRCCSAAAAIAASPCVSPSAAGFSARGCSCHTLAKQEQTPRQSKRHTHCVAAPSMLR